MKTRIAILSLLAGVAFFSPQYFGEARMINPGSSTLMNPPYLGELPTVERVEAEIKGSDEIDTNVRQKCAFVVLQGVIRKLAGSRSKSQGLTADEQRLVDQYWDGWRRHNHPPSAKKDQDRWFTLESQYLQDAVFKDGLLQRFLSDQLRTAFYQAAGKQPPSPTPVANPTANVKMTRAQADAYDAHFKQGNTYLDAKQYEKAIEAYKKAIAVLPDISYAHNGLGLAYRGLNRYPEAVAELKEAVRLDPNDPTACKNLAMTYFSLRDYSKAVTTLQQLLRLKPSDEHAHLFLGDGYKALKEYDKAVAAYREAVRLRPNNSSAWAGLGFSYYYLSQDSEAVNAFQQAIRLQPDYAYAYRGLGFAYAGMGRKEDALQVYKKLQGIDQTEAQKVYDSISKMSASAPKSNVPTATNTPSQSAGSTNAHLAEGNKFLESEDYARALEAYRKATALEPSANAYNGLGLAYSALKQYSNTVSAFQQAIRLQPRDATLHCNLASTYIEMEQYENAKGASREALSLKPDYADATNLLGVAHFRLKQYPEAAGLFQQAIRLTPDNAALFHNLGKTYFLMGRKEETQRIYRRLLALDKEMAQKLYEVMNPAGAASPKPNAPSSGAANPDAYTAQGDKYYEAKDYANAIEAYKKAISLSPSAGAYSKLGDSYDALEEYPEAVAASQQAIRLDPKNADYREGLGYTYFFMGKIEDALRVSQELETIHPPKAKALERYIRTIFSGVENDPEKLIALGRESASFNRSVEAANVVLAIFRRVIVLNRDAESVAHAYHEIGKIHKKLAQSSPQKDAKATAAFQQAVAFYQQTIRLKPDNADAHFNLGDTYVRLGRKQEAQQVHQTLVKLNSQKARELLAEIEKSK